VSDELLVRFGRALREEGLPVGPGRVSSFCAAAALLSPGDLYWAGRATLVARRDEIAVYDTVFRRFFGGEQAVAPPPRRMRVLVVEREEETALASSEELLKQKSFALCSRAELARLEALMARIRLDAPLRRTRRRVAARAGAPDLRRTIRRSFRTGGEPVERLWRARRRERRRLVLVLDVSGSMADYSRALLMFAHAALQADPRWEAFCFGTRLTRLTKALGAGGADAALARASEEVFDWDGGTRIGESLERLLRDFAPAVRGSIAIVCSDGLEVGDPELLEAQMARLSRLARAVVWLNPLSESPAYEPLARGMKAALPHVDVFVSGHNLASLEELGAQLARL
jgi:uncharacterized protein